jgi:hypothetical protein
MTPNRTQIAVLLGATFLTGSAVVPWSAAYLATVGWVLFLVVAPLFAVIDHRAKRP